jgi:hypothetical protein
VNFVLVERREELLPRLLELSPGFRRAFRRELRLWRGETLVASYADLALFARFLVDAYQRGSVEAFPGIFQAVEESLAREEPALSEQVTWGLFEDLWSQAGLRLADPEVFLVWLGPRSQRAWDEVARAWRTRPRLMELLRAERRRSP